jgi:hypothetical protein
MKKHLLILIALTIVHGVPYAQNLVMSEKARVGFTLNFNPKKRFEFIELEVDKRSSPRLSIGAKIGYIQTPQSFTGFNFRRQYLSGGVTWHIFPKHNFFLDASLHAMYLKIHRTQDVGYFRGGGVMASVRMGYDIGKFGFGLKIMSTFNIGQTHLVNLNIKLFDYYWDALRLGVNLSYKI